MGDSHQQILREPQLCVGSKEAGTGQCSCGEPWHGSWWGFDAPTELRPLSSQLWLLSLPLRPTRGHQVHIASVPHSLLTHPSESLGRVLPLSCTWHPTLPHHIAPRNIPEQPIRQRIQIPRGDEGQGLAILLGEAHQGLSQ